MRKSEESITIFCTLYMKVERRLRGDAVQGLSKVLDVVLKEERGRACMSVRLSIVAFPLALLLLTGVIPATLIRPSFVR